MQTRGRSQILRWGASMAVALALVVGFTPAASASTSLAGEELSNNTEDWATIFGPDAAAICDGAGASRLPFALQGPADGPFPGTFTETGVAVVGRLTTTLHWDVDVDAGPILGFRASFTIVSGDTVIEGRTWLANPPGADRPIAGCGSFTDGTSVLTPGQTFSGFEIVLPEFPVRYRATVTTPTGSSSATGMGTGFLLAEHYVRTNCPPPPLACNSESSGWGGGEIFS